MSVPSLLRVMVMRDAESITLEAGRVPQLRRKGNPEALSLPAIEPQMLDDFARPLLAGRPDTWPQEVAYTEPDGTTFAITINKATQGLRLVGRKASAKPEAKEPWWAGSKKPATPDPKVIASPSPSPSSPAITTTTTTMVPDGTRLAALIGPFVAIARERRASDVILSTGQVPRLRIEGRVEQLSTMDVADDELAAAVHAVGNNADLSLDVAGARVRVNAFAHLNGVGVAARLINDRVPSLADLDLPAAELGAVVDQRDGLILVCGPTGSGKSTTLASLVDLVDQRRAVHVITIEDPIEYRFSPRRSIIHQREVGAHVPSFAAGLRAALREAPDVILLGELRDRETIAAALTAAETGHLVLATLHASSAVGAIDRVIDAFPDTQQRQVRWQLAATLRHVITQFLLPRRDGGRVPAIELAVVTQAVANLMRKGELHMLQSTLQTGRDQGMIPLERSLAKLIESGTVSPQVVKKIAADHDLLAALSGKLR